MASTTQGDRREEEEAPHNEDEDTGAQVAPIVKLEEVAVTTGEEDEDAILDMKAKLYRFDKDGNQWKERGAGTVKLLKHKETGKVRLVMRQSKTLKICANHFVLRTMSVQEHAGNEKSCVWHAADYADGELKDELFCMRFGSTGNCKTFMETVHQVAKSQNTQEESEDATETAGSADATETAGSADATETAGSADATETAGSEDATETAGLLEKLSVDENKTEDKSGEEGVPKEEEKESKSEEAEKKSEEPASST